MKKYRLTKVGMLLRTTGAVKCKTGIASIDLLVDTGSTYTILPWEHLIAIGYEPTMQLDTVRIFTASGYVVAPRFKSEWFSCFGLSFKSFPIVIHTLPSRLSGFGLLGMDFLYRAKAQIDVFHGQVIAEAVEAAS
jgi:predicted aspartyl protease